MQVLKEILSKRDVEGDSAEAEQQRKSRCLEAIEATNWVLDSVDQKELAAHYGLKQVKDDPESKVFSRLLLLAPSSCFSSSSSSSSSISAPLFARCAFSSCSHSNRFVPSTHPFIPSHSLAQPLPCCVLG